MKLTTYISFGLLIVWVVLAIIDIWFNIVSWEVFLKLTLTIILLGVIAFAVRILRRNMQ